jgi:hypothetical protein
MGKSKEGPPGILLRAVAYGMRLSCPFETDTGFRVRPERAVPATYIIPRDAKAHPLLPSTISLICFFFVTAL